MILVNLEATGNDYFYNIVNSRYYGKIKKDIDNKKPRN